MAPPSPGCPPGLVDFWEAGLNSLRAILVKCLGKGWEIFRSMVLYIEYSKVVFKWLWCFIPQDAV
jgi:hypothetical protein